MNLIRNTEINSTVPTETNCCDPSLSISNTGGICQRVLSPPQKLNENSYGSYGSYLHPENFYKE